jgi:hypothetical protein
MPSLRSACDLPNRRDNCSAAPYGLAFDGRVSAPAARAIGVFFNGRIASFRRWFSTSKKNSNYFCEPIECPTQPPLFEREQIVRPDVNGPRESVSPGRLGGCRFNRLTPSHRRRQSRRTGIYDAGAFGWALNEQALNEHWLLNRQSLESGP